MRLIDTHAHLDEFFRDGSLPQVLERARAAGVSRVITCSTNPRDWALYSKLAADNRDFVSWQIGIHPTDIGSEADILALEALPSMFFSDAPPVAVGEIGLDFHTLPADPEAALKEKNLQLEIFKRQLGIARDLNASVCVHARDAFEECVAEMSKLGVDFSKAVFHCFSGSEADIRRLNELGGRGSFTGIITYKNAGEMRRAMLAQGIDRLMLETDCPYLSPAPNRGKRCEPAFIADTAKAAAEIFGMSPEYLAEAAARNAEEFFLQ